MLQLPRHIAFGVSLLFLFLGTQMLNTLHVWEEAHQHEQSGTVPTDCDLCDVIQNFQQEAYDLPAPSSSVAILPTVEKATPLRLAISYCGFLVAHPANKAPPVLG